RLRAEVQAAIPSMAARWRFIVRQLHALVRAPLSPTRMARRANVIAGTDVAADCARVAAPTLVVTGQAPPGQVVSVPRTLLYLDLIANARQATIQGTGHLGSITRPEAFLAAVAEFIDGLPDRRADGTSPGATHDAA